MKDDRVYLDHIIDCICRIEKYTSDGKAQFMALQLVQDAVIRNLQTMAESAQRIPAALKVSHPAIDWRAISGFRNILVHDYLGVDLEQVWNVVEHRLRPLKAEVEQMRSESGE